MVNPVKTDSTVVLMVCGSRSMVLRFARAVILTVGIVAATVRFPPGALVKSLGSRIGAKCLTISFGKAVYIALGTFPLIC